VAGVREGVRHWFDCNLRRIMGNGSGTFFWTNNWVRGIPLGVRFSRLFELTENRWGPVMEMSKLGWGEGERRGGGGGDYSHGKRITLGNVFLCYVTLFCRLMFLTSGGG